MKKATLVLLLLSGCAAGLQAQQRVGINVTAPTENLQVDSTIKIGKSLAIGTGTPGRKNLLKFGDGDYVTIGEEQADDKLYIRYGDLIFFRGQNSAGGGRIGIQTESPTAELDLNGTLRIRGNGAAAGKVLTSDASGNATWQTAPVRNDIYTVGSADFKSEHGDAPVWISGGTGGAYYSTAYYGNMVAPVHLPDDAKVTQITILYLDNTNAEDISFNFYGEYSTVALAGSYNSFSTVNSSGASSSYRLATITPSSPITIDNAVYNYQVNAFVHWSGSPTTFAVKSVKFYYTY